MYHKVSVYLDEVPQEYVQLQLILNRCHNAEQLAKEHGLDYNCAIALAHLDCSVILLVIKNEEWESQKSLNERVDLFMQALLGYDGKLRYKIEEIIASEAHSLLRDRPIDCGDVPFPTADVKHALENSPMDGLHIEEQYFDLDLPDARLWSKARSMDNDIDVFHELKRISEAPAEHLERCFPVHYALMSGRPEEAEKARNLLISGLLKYHRVKSRRIVLITIKSMQMNLRRLDEILESARDSICIFRFDTTFDMTTSDAQETLRSIANRLYKKFIELQFFFIVKEEQYEMFAYLRNLLVAIPILDIDVSMSSLMESERSIVAEWLRQQGIRKNDLEDKYYQAMKSDYSHPEVDFQKIYSSHVLNAVYPQYSTLFPELRIAGLRSNASYAELKRLFPQDDIRDDVNALIDLHEHLGANIPILPPKARNQFTYAVVGEKGMGHDELIHHHSAILHDLGFIKDRHIVTLDMIDLTAEARKSSVVAILDKFEEAESGIMVVDLEGAFEYTSDLDPYRMFLDILLNNELDFALYFKIGSEEWGNIIQAYPSTCFVIRQVFELEPLGAMQAVELFSYEANRMQIEVTPEVGRMLMKWIIEQQDSPNYQHRITLKQLVNQLRTSRRLWGYKQKMSTEQTTKEFVLDQEIMKTLLREFTRDYNFY